MITNINKNNNDNNINNNSINNNNSNENNININYVKNNNNIKIENISPVKISTNEININQEKHNFNPPPVVKRKRIIIQNVLKFIIQDLSKFKLIEKKGKLKYIYIHQLILQKWKKPNN